MIFHNLVGKFVAKKEIGYEHQDLNGIN